MDTLANAATTTPLSIKNTWNQDIIAEWAAVMPVGSPSSTVAFYAGTSTLSGIAYNTAVATALFPNCLLNGQTMTTSGISQYITSDNPTLSTATLNGACVIRPNEYFLLYQRQTDPKWAVTSTADTGVDIKYSVRIRVMSTSTQTY